MHSRKLIAARARIEPRLLQDPSVDLKSIQKETEVRAD
jgi:hypothetical protein